MSACPSSDPAALPADVASDVGSDAASDGGPDTASIDASEPTVAPEASLEAYYVDSYDASRARFLATSATLAQIYDNVEQQALAIPSQTDDDLTIDTTYIPAQGGTHKGLLIMMLGVHGVEAFAGSAAVQMFTAELLPDVDTSSLSILFVHAVNPWGFRHKRRVSENNVDLNRNMSVSKGLFSIVNAPYAEIDDFLNPTEPVSEKLIDGAPLDTLIFAGGYERAKLQQAILQGQYQFPLGLYYGGADFEPNRNVLDPLLKEKIEHHDHVFLMDFHTGYGERGRLHLFGAPGLGTPAAMDAVFAGYEIDTGENDENFYEIDGDMIIYVGDLAVAAGKTYVGMTMEYGTLDSQTDEGALVSLVNVKLENQGFHHGFTTEEARQRVGDAFLAGYLPVETEWRVKILSDTREMLPVFIDRFNAL